jgi:4-hydroxyphenylpyruvate dioxygenase-like putative hemolysin
MFCSVRLTQRAQFDHLISMLKKVDHITYACEKGTIEKWAWFHIEVEGGTLINRISTAA